MTDYKTPTYIVDEYIRNDAIRVNNKVGTLVFDYIAQQSPHYSQINDDFYIDERLAIELPKIETEQLV